VLSLASSRAWALYDNYKGDEREVELEAKTYVSSSMAPREDKKATISVLLPYSPSGLSFRLSRALKSTLMIEAYAPGESALINSLRDS
jgi:hypothetical protein